MAALLQTHPFADHRLAADWGGLVVFWLIPFHDSRLRDCVPLAHDLPATVGAQAGGTVGWNRLAVDIGRALIFAAVVALGVAAFPPPHPPQPLRRLNRTPPPPPLNHHP